MLPRYCLRGSEAFGRGENIENSSVWVSHTKVLYSPCGRGWIAWSEANAIRERGRFTKNLLIKKTPLPRWLGFASTRAPSPARGEGKRVWCTRFDNDNSFSEVRPGLTGCSQGCRGLTDICRR